MVINAKKEDTQKLFIGKKEMFRYAINLSIERKCSVQGAVNEMIEAIERINSTDSAK